MKSIDPAFAGQRRKVGRHSLGETCMAEESRSIVAAASVGNSLIPTKKHEPPSRGLILIQRISRPPYLGEGGGGAGVVRAGAGFAGAGCVLVVLLLVVLSKIDFGPRCEEA
jgi:hypothetical protein